MTKPHEETWQLDADNDVRRTNKHGERTSLVCLRAAAGTIEGQVLIAAAPDMARALVALSGHEKRLQKKRGDGVSCVFCLARFEETHMEDCPTHMARIALKKAGVL